MADLVSRALDLILQAYKRALCSFAGMKERSSIAWQVVWEKGDVKSVSSGCNLVIVVKRRGSVGQNSVRAVASPPGVHPHPAMMERGTLHFAPYRPKTVQPVSSPPDEASRGETTLEDILE